MPKAIIDVEWVKVKNYVELQDLAEILKQRYGWFTVAMKRDIDDFCEQKIADELGVVIGSFV